MTVIRRQRRLIESFGFSQAAGIVQPDSLLKVLEKAAETRIHLSRRGPVDARRTLEHRRSLLAKRPELRKVRETP
jgi:hypothetical protein